MSAVRTTQPMATVLNLGDCEVAAELLINPSEYRVIGTDVRVTEKSTGDFALIEADAPEQLERFAAELVVAAQKLREARAATTQKAGIA